MSSKLLFPLAIIEQATPAASPVTVHTGTTRVASQILLEVEIHLPAVIRFAVLSAVNAEAVLRTGYLFFDIFHGLSLYVIVNLMILL